MCQAKWSWISQLIAQVPSRKYCGLFIQTWCYDVKDIIQGRFMSSGQLFRASFHFKVTRRMGRIVTFLWTVVENCSTTLPRVVPLLSPLGAPSGMFSEAQLWAGAVFLYTVIFTTKVSIHPCSGKDRIWEKTLVYYLKEEKGQSMLPLTLSIPFIFWAPV